MPILTNSKQFIQNEFSNLDLGDKRLSKRAVAVATFLNENPASSIPSMTNGNAGDLKAIYRFYRNPKVEDQKLLKTHYENTIERMNAYSGKILLLNDSTFVTPGKGCEGLLSRGKGKENCVRTHFCLAVSDDGKHIFGMLNWQTLTDPISKTHPELKNESDIWIYTIKKSKEFVLSSSHGKKLLDRCIFVADREADEFELLNFLRENEIRFIIRSQYNRTVFHDKQELKLEEAEEKSLGHGKTYSIKVQTEKTIVDVAVKRSVLRNLKVFPPEDVKKYFLPIDANIVLVTDTKTNGEQVKWRLLTSEEVNNADDSLFVVESYSHRWKIEEVNKGAKTGVRVEERQFTELDHFLPFLAMAFVIAWRLVALRNTVEVAPQTKLENGFTPEEVAYMKVQAKKFELPMRTVKDGLYLIARLGGFTRSYERPGWQILWQGWIKFFERVEGFTLARE